MSNNPSNRPRIVAADTFPLNPGDLDWRSLEAIGDVTIFDRTTANELVERCIDADIILSNKLIIDAPMLAMLPKLRLICVTATGFNGINIAAARSRGIVVCNVPEYSTDAVAQFTFAMILELCHRVGLHSDSVHAGDWVKSADFCYTRSPQVELVGRTLGIVGFGRIGRRVAELAAAFRMKVLATKPSRPVVGLATFPEWTTTDELFARADVVTLHCPLTQATERLVNAERLNLMKRSSFLINISRGGLIDEPALANALNEERIAGAAVDVVTREPMVADHPFLHAKNCIITPHIAWTTLDARRRLLASTVENINAFLNGRPINVVN